MASLDADVPWWVLLVVLAALAALLALTGAIPALGRAASGRRKKTDDVIPDSPRRGQQLVEDLRDALETEPWCPKMEIKDWQQAGELPGCPWNFDSCHTVPDVLERIWRSPLCPELQTAFDALSNRVKNVQVARVQATMPTATHFTIVYSLHTGAELFGGSPLEHAVGLDLGQDEDVRARSPSPRRGGLRRRRGSGSPTSQEEASEATDILLPCLLPFYRIHDGFGVLLSTRHLPLLLSSPTEGINGSCYYVYPARGLEPVTLRRPLIRFARVDRTCSACADRSLEQPVVVYLERNGEQTEDDEEPLAFIADTVSNVAGQRVVPPSYMGGPSSM